MKDNNLRTLNGIPIYKRLELFFVLIIMCVLPWISHLKIMNYDETTAQYFANSNGEAADFFLYGKAIAIIVLGIFIIFMLIGENIFPDNIIYDTTICNKKYRKLMVLALLYAVMSILSAVFSKYATTVIKGSPTEFESIFVVVSYMLLFIAGINWFYYEDANRLVKIFITILIIITIFLTSIEFFYRPLFEISWFKCLLASSEYQSLIDSIKVAKFTDMVALTFYNPNYYGGFCLLLFPFSVEFYINEKEKIKKCLYCVTSAGMFFCELSAKSTASFYLIFVEIILILFIHRKTIKEWWEKIVVLIIVTFAYLLFANVLTDGKVVNISKNTVVNETYDMSDKNEVEIFKLEDIQINNNTLKLISTEHTLNITVNGTQLEFTDENNNTISAVYDDDKLKLNTQDFSMISMWINLNNQLVIDLGYSDTIEFYIIDSKFYGVGQNGAKIDNVSRSNRKGEQFYSIFTGRGYAWVNTLPLLKSTLILGHGTGTFPFYFQQNDYVGLINTHGSIKFVIDKPHSMYLQTAVENGCIAMTIMIAIFGFVIFNFIKNNKKILKAGEKVENLSQIAIASFISSFAFMIYGIANDSMVTVNPVFWIILGISVSAVYGVENLKNINK